MAIKKVFSPFAIINFQYLYPCKSVQIRVIRVLHSFIFFYKLKPKGKSYFI